MADPMMEVILLMAAIVVLGFFLARVMLGDLW